MKNNHGRAVAACSAVAAVMLGVVGCGSSDPDSEEVPDAGGPVTIDYWTWVPGAADAVDKWNADHPDIQVDISLIQLGAQGGYAKMFQALSAGNAPCLANIEHRNLSSFIVEGGVLDIAEYASEYEDRFQAWLWNGNVYGDALYGIPNSSGPMAMYYRADLFEEAGIDVPETWDDFREAAATMREALPDTYLTTFATGDAGFYAALAQQNDATWFDVDGDNWLVDIDSPESQEVADYWQGLIDEDLVKAMPDQNDAWYLAVQDGQVASWISANWGAALLEGNATETEGDWRVAPMPQWNEGEQVSANWGGSSTAVLEGCEHPAEAVEFAAWLQSDPEGIQNLLAGGAGWPAITDLSEVPAAREENPFFGGQVVNQVFEDAASHIDDKWHWVPTTQSTLDTIQEGLQGVANGEGTLRDVLTDGQEQSVQSLEDKGLPVNE